MTAVAPAIPKDVLNRLLWQYQKPENLIGEGGTSWISGIACNNCEETLSMMSALGLMW